MVSPAGLLSAQLGSPRSLYVALSMTGSGNGTSSLSSEWGPADTKEKERSPNQPHSWEIMHAIVS